MSVSSATSDYDEGGDGLVQIEGEEADYYALLNVPKNASADEINRSYRQKCMIFHPDRHHNPVDKAEAEKFFVKLRKAYTTLVDPQKRQIYDTVGVRGLELSGWEMISKSETPENIRREYEFLRRLNEMQAMLQRIHPSGAFICKTSLNGLFAENPDYRCPPQLVAMALSQNVECMLTASDKVGLSGRVKMSNGRGDGSFVVSWKRALPSLGMLEAGITTTPESVAFNGKLARTIFSKYAFMVQPSLQYYPLLSSWNPGCSFVFSMALNPFWQGSIMYHVGIQQALTTSFVHTESNRPNFICNLTLSPSGSNARVAYIKRFSENDSFYETSCVLNLLGVNPTVTFERRLSRFTRIGFSLSLSMPTCLLNGKIKLKTGTSVYECQFSFCDNQEDIARATLYGVVLPMAVFHFAKAIFRKTYERFMSIFDDHAEERVVSAVKKEEARSVTELMRPTAERIAREEAAKGGLVIVEAKYGQMQGFGREAEQYPLLGDEFIDVTVPLQAMVNDSKLRIFSCKGQLPGFYDPCPYESKMLKVVYKYRNILHSVSVPDEMALSIPLASHRLSANAEDSSVALLSNS